ncbi:hypothetical protein V6Z11_A13G098900 [Gossypium hirsutum]
MGFRLPRFVKAKSLKQTLSFSEKTVVPKGHIVRFISPISFLNHPFFQKLFSEAEEEYEFNHPMRALTIPCSEEAFLDLIGSFQSS